MINLAGRPVWMLKATAAMCYGTAVIFLSGAALVLVYWHLTWVVVRDCSGMAVISAGFIYAAIRNQRMASKRAAEALHPPASNPESPSESN
jgi:hypothetical protein